MHFNGFVNDFTENCCQLTASPPNPSNLQLPVIKELYLKAKSLDSLSQEERSNEILTEALVAYKQLLFDHGDQLNDTIFKQISERCVERMRFVGKLKAAVEINKKLIERFNDDPEYRNQLAVTYLLGNQ